MILTPFGNLDYGSDEGLEQWQAAHDQQHRTERLALLQQGVYVTGFPLAAKLNSDWFGRHMLMHLAYERYFNPDNTQTAQQLSGLWGNESQFYRWHQIHNQLHQSFGNSLGIISTQPTGFQTPINPTVVVSGGALLLESGSYLLQENGSKILL